MSTQENRLYSPGVVLIGVNLIPLFGVLILGWDTFLIFFLYWLESAVMGIYSITKLAIVARLSGVFLVPFFMFHYGMFMFVHLVFIGALFAPESTGGFPLNFGLLVSSLAVVFPALLGLLISHGISFFNNFIGKKEYLRGDPRKHMTMPYARIMVMHIALIFGGMLISIFNARFFGLPLLIALKTFIDYKAHVREHRQTQGVKSLA